MACGRLVIALTLIACFSSLPARAREPAKPQWLVVTAPAFRDAIEPLCEHRKKQGLQVVVVQTTDVLTAKEVLAVDGRKLRERVRKICRESRGPHYMLLVGDTGVSKLDEREKKVVPPLRGTTGRMKEKLTDHGYGCLGESLVPEAAVGRLPARSVAEAKQMVAKTLAFEDGNRPGGWRRRLTVLAGAPGFGPVVDKMVESLAFSRLGQLDGIWEGRAIYQNPSSIFNLPDDQLHKRARDYVEAGQALVIYLGHSNALGLYGGGAHFLDRDDWGKLGIREGGGVFVTFGCYGCQLLPEESYGVAAIRNPRGPVAVVGSLGECFSTMALPAAEATIAACAGTRLPDRLAEPWLKLHQGIAAEKTNDVFYGLLDLADGNPRIPRGTQRHEHLEMFILFGDPALKLPQVPVDIKLTCKDEVQPGKTVLVAGELPARLMNARLSLTVQRPLNSQPVDLEPLPKEPASARDRAVLANHERANRFAVASAEFKAREGRFEVKLKLPAKLPWPRLTVRVYAEAGKADGLGLLVLRVKDS
jgi:hypothetical protein